MRPYMPRRLDPQPLPVMKNPGFPINNVGNDRRGSFRMKEKHRRTDSPSPLPVIPAVFSGNPVKIIFIQSSIGGSYLLGKASMTSEYRTGLEPAPQGMKRKDGFPINNVGNDRRGS